jgi:hypothetical protein
VPQLFSRWDGDGYSGKENPLTKVDCEILTEKRIVAIVVGFCGVLLFFFVPESYWDRAPVPKSRKQSKNSPRFSLFSSHSHTQQKDLPVAQADSNDEHTKNLEKTAPLGSANGTHPKRPTPAHRINSMRHVGFAPEQSRHGGEDAAADHGAPVPEGAMSTLGGESSGKIAKATCNA